MVFRPCRLEAIRLHERRPPHLRTEGPVRRLEQELDVQPGNWRDLCSECGEWKSTGCARGCRYNTSDRGNAGRSALAQSEEK
jgi:hypothetical protein